eukprot:g3030.t1
MSNKRKGKEVRKGLQLHNARRTGDRLRATAALGFGLVTVLVVFLVFARSLPRGAASQDPLTSWHWVAYNFNSLVLSVLLCGWLLVAAFCFWPPGSRGPNAVTAAEPTPVQTVGEETRKREDQDANDESQQEELTPLAKLEVLSRLLGVPVYGKCAYQNPATGSLKDTAAAAIVAKCVEEGKQSLCQGTSGSTGVSLAKLGVEQGISVVLFVPENCERQKLQLMEAYGATVRKCPVVAYNNPGHYSNQCKRYAAKNEKTTSHHDQFETFLNPLRHYEKTGKEIWTQLLDAEQGGALQWLGRRKSQKIAFVMSAGTGGTLRGVSAYIKAQLKAVRTGDPICKSKTAGGTTTLRTILADHQASSLAAAAGTGGAAFDPQRDGEGARMSDLTKDTITEGFGGARVPGILRPMVKNSELDLGVRVSDADAVLFAHFLRYVEGHYCGASSAVHLGAIVAAAGLYNNESGTKTNAVNVFVTMLCDGGARYEGKFWNEEFLVASGLYPTDRSKTRQEQNEELLQKVEEKVRTAYRQEERTWGNNVYYGS